jgi:hypothetical protein
MFALSGLAGKSIPRPPGQKEALVPLAARTLGLVDEAGPDAVDRFAADRDPVILRYSAARAHQ